MGLTVSQVVGTLLERFPLEWAEPWDRCGLVAGDPDSNVDRILVGLDLDATTLEQARVGSADLVLVHHPPFLEPVGDLTPGRGGARNAWEALREGIAVAAFHTNLDRSPEGAVALAHALDLDPREPLEVDAYQATIVTVYVPRETSAEIAAAMTAAGAGSLGRYRGCAFDTLGTGHFIPQDGSEPERGAAGRPESSGEARVEMVCAPPLAGAVAAAARSSHPYEEPLITITPVEISRGVARLGRLCDASGFDSVGALAARCAERLGIAPRVWGDPDAKLDAIALGNGSVTGLLDAARRAGATALVGGEVRYHSAQEAAEDGLAIIEVGHDVSELPLVAVLAETARTLTENRGIDVAQARFDPRWKTWGG